jgi:hypothetical protein
MFIDITEKEYRKLELNSYSSLKDFSTDRRKYYKKYILKEKVKEKENKAANMGRIVDCLLMEPDKFDDYFFLSTCVKIPGGMLGEFIFKLSILIGENTVEGKIMSDEEFEEHALSAYSEAGFKIAFKTVIKKLEDPENRLYYEECLKVNYLNMTMVSTQEVTNAEKIVEELQNNSITSSIVTLETSESFKVLNQLKIQGYSIDGMYLKSMLDKLIINHKRKTVKIYDLKCTWSVENFYKEYYLYRRSYIQAYLYYNAILQETLNETSSIYGYTVEMPSFIVCDSINYYSPLIYTLDESDLEDAYNGFEHKGTKYPGVKQIIKDLKWAILNDIWRISRINFNKAGILNIKDS